MLHDRTLICAPFSTISASIQSSILFQNFSSLFVAVVVVLVVHSLSHCFLFSFIHRTNLIHVQSRDKALRHYHVPIYSEMAYNFISSEEHFTQSSMWLLDAQRKFWLHLCIVHTIGKMYTVHRFCVLKINCILRFVCAFESWLIRELWLKRKKNLTLYWANVPERVKQKVTEIEQ